MGLKVIHQCCHCLYLPDITGPLSHLSVQLAVGAEDAGHENMLCSVDTQYDNGDHVHKPHMWYSSCHNSNTVWMDAVDTQVFYPVVTVLNITF